MIVAVVGIGNELAGDDGAGLEVIRRLEPVWGADDRVLLARLEGDLFAAADLVEQAGHILFADAIAGDEPGCVRRADHARRAFSPSFHQTDIASVMHSLEALRVADPFPRWELWGVTIRPPEELQSGFSEPVERGVAALAAALDARLRELLASTERPTGTCSR